MGVTKPRIVGFLILFSFFAWACSVELSNDVPGAAGNCKPSDSDVSEFHLNVFTNFVLSTCGGATCHNDPVNSSGFKFDGHDASDDADAQLENYCFFFNFGQDLLGRPQESGHSGGDFSSDSGFQNVLVNWINTL